MPPTAPAPDEIHCERLHQLAAFLRESEQILADFDAWREEHSGLDDQPLDDDEHSRHAVKRDADTWRSFNRVRAFAKELLATAEVQVQQLNPAHLQSRWPWQLGVLDDALKQLGALQQDWLKARDALPPTARPGSFAYDDALADRNDEAWSYLDDWSTHGKALLEIHAAAEDSPPRSPALTPATTHTLPAAPAEDPLVPRVILTSPDQLAQLRIAPDPDPAEPWWTLRHAHHGDQRAWSMSFDARTPVEIIAAVTDALTAPTPPPTAPGDPYDPLRAAGWHAPQYHDGLTSPEGMSAPNGLATVDRLDHEHRPAGWIVETIDLSARSLPSVWRAQVDGDTPPHLVAALFGALTDETPLIREPQRVPRLAATHGRTSAGQISADTFASALQRRTTALAQRRTPPPAPVSAPASMPKPRRLR